jgi:hypothetical protein
VRKAASSPSASPFSADDRDAHDPDHIRIELHVFNDLKSINNSLSFLDHSSATGRLERMLA